MEGDRPAEGVQPREVAPSDGWRPVALIGKRLSRRPLWAASDRELVCGRLQSLELVDGRQTSESDQK
jgi:hypothetical protein